MILEMDYFEFGLLIHENLEDFVNKHVKHQEMVYLLLFIM